MGLTQVINRVSKQKARFSIRNLTVVLLCIGLPIFFFDQYAWTPNFFKYSSFFITMVAIFFTDAETKIIPNFFSFPLIALGLLFGFLSGTPLSSLYGGIALLSLFAAIAFVAKLYYKKDAMGGGDIKLAAAIGTYWGVQTALMGCYFGIIICGVCAIPLLLLKKKGLLDELPLGPFLIIGTVIAVYWGDFLLDLYLRVI